jgi:hypothetical protein
MGDKKLFHKIFNELYEIKDSYGADKQAKQFNLISTMIQEGKDIVPIGLDKFNVKWGEKTHLAVYKEGLGINPIDINTLESAKGKRIPLDNFDADFFEYYFIIPKALLTDGTVSDRFKLEEINNKFKLSKVGKNETGFEIQNDEINKGYKFRVKEYLEDKLFKIVH